MAPATAAPRPHAPGDPPTEPAPRLDVSTPRASRPRAGGVRALAGSLVAAALYTLACPPYEWSLLAWGVPAVLLLSTRRLRPMRAALCGWLFAVAFGWGMTSWLVHASLDYFGLDRLRASSFVVLLWAVLACPYAVLAGASAWLDGYVPSWARPAAGAWMWAAAEVARTAVTRMPWELLGHTQYRHTPLIQIADVGGVYAVSFVMAFVGLAAAELLVAPPHERRAAGRGLAGATALLAATLAYGAHAADAYAGTPSGADARTIVVVQGNVANAFRWKRAFFERSLLTYASLSRTAADAGADLVVWPENAVNFYLDREPMLLAQLAPVARGTRDGLLLGAPRLADTGLAYNAAYLIDAGGRIAQTYDKHQLVPFAERDPFGEPRGIDPNEPVYAAGEGTGVFDAATMRIGAVICYEVVFPELVADRVRAGAEVLVNIANDAWLDAGDGSAPRQHFSMAIFRAVETRRYLVRAAATGISGLITPAGAIAATLPLDRAGTTVARIALRRDVTAYVRWRESWLAVVGLALAVAAWGSRP